MTKKIILLLAIASPFLTYFLYSSLLKLKNKKYPIVKLAMTSIMLLMLALGSLRYYDNYSPSLIKPNISLKPIEVLNIQLDSLQRNNLPFNDAGIEQVWEFAHPNNKKITGPLKKFKKMIYSENYKILLSHLKSEVIVLSESDNKNVYKVIILAKDKKKYFYIWQIDKVLEEGDLINCWMTTMVSNPKYVGEII
jgi:hypothetical protein|tara:strand:+ start:1030 stop:1611 length:582 start_codon:yes stop_codon:yes gene_type:complete